MENDMRDELLQTVMADLTETFEALRRTERTPEDGISLGRAVGGPGKRILLCRGTESGCVMLSAALASGALSVGSEVWDAGAVPVPAAASASKNYDIMVAVSAAPGGNACDFELHNPDGSRIGETQVRELFRRNTEDPPKLVPYSHTGCIRTPDRVIEDYIRRISRDRSAPKSPVFLDCVCGTSSLCAPQILKGTGADVISVNAHVDADRREPAAPGDLKGMISADVGTIGLTLSADGTRATLTDERGSPVSAQDAAAVMIAYLKPNVFVMPVGMSKLLDDVFSGLIPVEIDTNYKPMSDRRMIRTDGTHEGTVAAVKENGADLALTGDGSFIFPCYSLCPDGMAAAVVFAEMASKNSIATVIAAFPDYEVLDNTVHYAGNREVFKKRFSDRLEKMPHGTVHSINGWRVDMDEGWFSVSFGEDTEDRILIRSESRDRLYAVTMMEEAKKLVDRCL